MSTTADRLAGVIKRRGAPIILRDLSRTTGPSPLNNPPDVEGGLVADGAWPAGSTTISLRASQVRGILLPGDRLAFGTGNLVTVGTAAPCRPNSAAIPGFDMVAITDLPLAIADGTPAQVTFTADLATYGMIGSYPLRLVDGQRIQSQDISVLISASGVPIPQLTWRVVLNGRSLSIVDIGPTYKRGDIVSYTLQAR